MRRDEAATVQAFLAKVGALPEILAYRIEPLRGPQHQLSAPIGHSDLIVLVAGTAFWIEAKSLTGRQRPEQAVFQRAVESAGGHYLILRDVATCLREISALVGGEVGKRLLILAG